MGDNGSVPATDAPGRRRAHGVAPNRQVWPVSRESMWEAVRMAWAMLSGRTERDVRAGRPREPRPPPAGDEPRLSKEGFVDEALPWLDAVYRFSLRLTHGDRDAAEDLAQETFLRAHRFWHTYEGGTNAKSWLFTICRNTYLHERDRARTQRERPAADLDPRTEELASAAAFRDSAKSPEREFFDELIDDEVVEAIDDLPEEFREVLVLSDLGDLKYAEIAELLDIPVGTMKSRLFRARKLLQERLRDFAIRSGYVQENA
jgi:RNA polymerase sigma-70 factor, ECF subfamily